MKPVYVPVGLLTFLLVATEIAGGERFATQGSGRSEREATTTVVFMEQSETQGNNELPTFRVITDPKQLEILRTYLANESAGFAFSLFKLAHSIAGTDYPYYIAIVDGGNHASQGFQLRGPSDRVQKFGRIPFIKLDRKAESFRTTLLHETGHMIISVLSEGKGIPTQQIAPMFHTTPAITDRGTAFNEGFAEHFEAIVAHFTKEIHLRDFYQHRRMTQNAESAVELGFLFPITDLSNYAQNFARYQSVRDNHYSFENACNVADYYRVQLSPSPDFERPRTPSQLVASEGFCATYFFWLVSEQLESLSDEQTEAAYRPVFEAVRQILNVPTTQQPLEVPSYLTAFIRQYGKEDSKLRARAIRLLYHLSHGAFFDEDYQERWTRIMEIHYRLDIEKIRALRRSLAVAEKAAVKRCLADVNLIDKRVGGVLAAVVPGVRVRLPVAFGDREIPLSFDINTVPTRIVALTPGISSQEVDGFLLHRDRCPYTDFADFTKRSGLRGETLGQIKPFDLGE